MPVQICNWVGDPKGFANNIPAESGKTNRKIGICESKYRFIIGNDQIVHIFNKATILFFELPVNNKNYFTNNF